MPWDDFPEVAVAEPAGNADWSGFETVEDATPETQRIARRQLQGPEPETIDWQQRLQQDGDYYLWSASDAELRAMPANVRGQVQAARDQITPEMRQQRDLSQAVDSIRRNAEQNPEWIANYRAQEKLISRMPFAGAIEGAASAMRVTEAAKNFQSGEYTDEDVARLANFLVESEHASEEQRNKPWHKKALDLVLDMIPYAIEFAATSGAYTGARGIAQRAVGTAAESVATRAAQATIPRAAGVVAQAAASPHMLARSTAEQQLSSVLAGEDQSFIEALPAGAVDTLAELGSERAGGVIGSVASRIIPGRLRSAIADAWMRHTGQGTRELAEAVASRTGWNGVIGELGEERVGEVIRGVFGQMGIGDFDFGTTGQVVTGQREGFEQLGVEAAAFSVPGAVSTTTQVAARAAERLEELRELRQKGFVTEADGREHHVVGATRRERMDAVDREIREREQEIQDASTVQRPETEVREAEGGPDVRGGREEPVRAEPEGEGASAPEVPVTGFTTSQGSTYEVSGQSTTRTKTPHEGHETGDVGRKEPSEITYYVTPEDAQRIGMHGSLHGKRAVIVRDGNLHIVSWNSKEGRWGQSPADREAIELSDTPSVGMAPIEFWDGTDAENGREYATWHAGNEITEIASEAPTTPPETLPGPTTEKPSEAVPTQETPAEIPLSDIARRLREVAGEEAQAVVPKVGRISVEDVRKAFPGAEITAPSEGQGWDVKLGTGDRVQIRFREETRLTPAQRRRAEKRYGKKFADDAEYYGRFQFVSRGENVPTVSLIELNSRLATPKHLTHEDLHRLMKMAPESVFQALAKKYAADLPADQQEEAIVRGLVEDRTGRGGFIKKMREFISHLLNSVGLGSMTEDEAGRWIDTMKVKEAKKSVPAQETPAQPARPPKKTGRRLHDSGIPITEVMERTGLPKTSPALEHVGLPRADDPKLGTQTAGTVKGKIVQIWRTATAREPDGQLHLVIEYPDGKRAAFTGAGAEAVKSSMQRDQPTAEAQSIEAERRHQRFRAAADLGLFTSEELADQSFLETHRENVPLLPRRSPRTPQEGQIWESHWPLGERNQFVITARPGKKRVRFALTEAVVGGETELPLDQFKAFFAPEGKLPEQPGTTKPEIVAPVSGETAETPAEETTMSRREIQQRAKELGIKGLNRKSDVLLQEIQEAERQTKPVSTEPQEERHEEETTTEGSRPAETDDRDRPPLSELGQTGKAGRLILADGSVQEVQYIAVEAEDIVPSHDARRNFEKNPEGDENERPYHDPKEGRASRDVVEAIAKADPNRVSLLVSDNPTPTDGPPMATPRGTILGGNARAMGMQLGYSRGGDVASRLKQAAVEASAKFGIDTGSVEGMSQPIIVRVLTKVGDKGEMSAILNESLTAAKSQATTAASRGARLSTATANRISSMLTGKSGEAPPTLREILSSPRKSDEIVQMLVRDGVWTQKEVDQYVDPKTSDLNEDGKTAIEQALLGRVYGDATLIGQSTKSSRQNTLSAIGPLTVLMSDETHGDRFREVYRTAIEALPEYKASGVPLRQHFMGQGRLIETPGHGDQAVMLMTNTLDTKGVRQFKKAMMEIVEALGVKSGVQTTSLFEVPATASTVDEAIDEVLGEAASEEFSIGKASEKMKGEGERFSEESRFFAAWDKALRAVKGKSLSLKSTKRAAEKAAADMAEWIVENGHFQDYYSRDNAVEKREAAKLYPELRDDANWAFFKVSSAIASNSTSLPENITEQLDAWGDFRNGQTFDVEIGRGERNLPTVKRSAFPLHGGAQAVKAQQYQMLNEIVRQQGGVEGAVKWLVETVPASEIRKLPESVGSGQLNGKQVRQIKNSVEAALGTSDKIPRMFMFGPKIGSYAMNLLGRHEYTTVDVWESRFWRSFFKNAPVSTGLETDTDTIKAFKEASEKFAEHLGVTPSAGQAIRWYYIIQKTNEAGYTKARSNDTISAYTAREVARRTADDTDAVKRKGQAAKPQRHRRSRTLRRLLGEEIFAEELTDLQQAADAAFEDAKNEAANLAKRIKGKGLPSNPFLDPEIVALSAKVAYKFAKAGVLKFASFTEQLSAEIGQKMVDQILPVLQSEWNKLHATGEFKGMEPVETEAAAERASVPTEGGDSPLTSIKNEVVNELRANRGVEELPEAPAQTRDEWMDAAASRIAASNGTIGPSLVAEINKNPRNLSNIEVAILQIHYRAVNNAFESAAGELFEAVDSGNSAAIAVAQTNANNLLDELATIEEATKAAGREWGRAGVARQIALNKDFSMAAMVNRARVANAGQPLTADQTAEIAEMSRQIESLNTRLKEEQAKTADLERQRRVDAEIKKTAKTKPKRKGKREQLQQKASDAVTAFKDKWSDLFQVGIVPDPKADAEKWAAITKAAGDVVKAYVDLGVYTFGEFIVRVKKELGISDQQEDAFREAWNTAKDAGEIPVPELDQTNVAAISRLAKLIERIVVESGTTEREAVVDAVHETLQEVLPEITRRETMDAMSGYGQFTPLSKDEIDQTIRDINGQLQQLAKLDDMEQGRAPAKTGPERRTPSDEERRLIQQVNEAKKRGGFAVANPETQLRTALAAAKTAIKNRISDMEHEIRTGERIVRERSELKPDAELQALRNHRDHLREMHKQLFPPPGATDEQKIAAAGRALDRAIQQLEEQIRLRDVAPREKPARLSSPELDAKRARLDALRAQRDALRVEMGFAEEQSRRLYEASLKKRIADYRQRIADGDFQTKPRKEARKLSREELDLKRELEDAKQEFFERLAKYRLDNLTGLERALDYARETAHLSRAAMTSIDLSAVFRQGGSGVFAHPVLGLKAGRRMMEAVFSRQAEFDSIEEIRNRPNGHLYETARLAITEQEGKVTRQEEAFMGRWGKKIAPIRASARAYTTFLNNLRADLFDTLVENLGRSGAVTLDEAKVIANFVNIATGRSNLGKYNSAAANLNTVFFAPRYVASRFQYLATPLQLPFMKTSGRVKKAIAKEYARHAVGLATFIGIVVALWNLANDDEDEATVELDPRSSDFGKIRIGETRIDPLSGLSQSVVFLARLATGQRKTAGGEIRPIRGEGVRFGDQTTSDVIKRFLWSKLAPVPGSAVDLLEGENVVGERVTPISAATELFIPLSFREIKETMISRGIPEGLAISALAILGMGTATYGPRTEYLTGNDEERQEQFAKFLDRMQWNTEDPFGDLLTAEQRQQVIDRRQEKRGLVIYNAMYVGDSEKELSARDKNLEHFQAMREEGLTLADANQLLRDYYIERGWNTTGDSFNARLLRLGEIYRE